MSDDQTHERMRVLCDKYERLCDLRQRQLSDVAPRAELVALAAAFPGALRELDCLPLEELERRLAALRAVTSARAQVEPWMLLQLGYHGCMRAVLRVRRLQLVSETSSQPFEYAPLPDEPQFNVEDLAAIRKPPGGRLNPWVLARVARDHAVSEACIEIALWGAPRRALP